MPIVQPTIGLSLSDDSSYNIWPKIVLKNIAFVTWFTMERDIFILDVIKTSSEDKNFLFGHLFLW